MARITKKDKNDPRRMDEAVSLYGMGKSTREIEKLTGINNRTVAREATRRGVLKGQLEEIVADLSQTETKLTQIDAKLSQMPVIMSQMIKDTAEARKLQIEFFNNAALSVVSEAMAMEAPDLHAGKAKMEIVSKGRESVLGKAPDVAVQVNNNFTLEDLLKDVKI